MENRSARRKNCKVTYLGELAYAYPVAVGVPTLSVHLKIEANRQVASLKSVTIAFSRHEFHRSCSHRERAEVGADLLPRLQLRRHAPAAGDGYEGDHHELNQLT